MRATLTVERGALVGSSWSVRPGQTVGVGRGPAATIVLPEPDLLPRHAMLSLGPDGLFVVDQGGPGGTRLNGAPLAPQRPVRVEAGDALELGGTLLRVEGEDLPGRDAATRRFDALEEAGPALPADRFETVRELGQGAMGRVVEVRRLADGRRFAAKVLFDPVDPGSEAFQRFLLEGSVAGRVQSPYVVGSAGVELLEGGYVALLMDLVEGPSLDAVLQRGPLHVADALRVGQDVAEALAALHAAKIVHRDVKPSNILLDRRGVARLTDFGIAKDLAGKGPTKSGQGLGTLSYLAPEQMLDAKRAGPRADLHALAATLHHALVGAPPFVGRTPEAIMRMVAFEAPRPIATRRPDLPGDVAALIDGLLAKDPERRRTTAREAADLLRAARLRDFPGHRFEALFGG